MRSFLLTVIVIAILACLTCQMAFAQCVGGSCPQPQVMAPQIGYQPQTTWQPQTAYRPRVTYEPYQTMVPRTTYQPVQVTPIWTPRTYHTPLRNAFFGRGSVSYMTQPIQIQPQQAPPARQ